MRLLVVALRSPFEGHSGNALILRNYLAYLGPRHVVDFASVGTAEEAGHPQLRGWCARVAMAPPEGAGGPRFVQAAGLLAGRPIRVSAHANRAMCEMVGRLMTETSYDAVVVQLCEAAQFVPAAARVPSVLDFEDPPHDKLERTRPWLEGRARLAASIDLLTMRRYEAWCARRFDRLVFVNQRDAEAFGAAHGCAGRVATIPHAVDAGPLPAPEASRAAHQMIVSGNMGHPPNIAAVDFLCREVFPRVRAAMPDATLRVVGANPTPAVLAWASVPGITVTGAVDDIRLEVSRARVALCGVPVVVGAQTKVLEAMACGTPVVTTPAGNYGIDAISGRDLHVADTPEAFALQVLTLLRGDGWTAMAEAGRRLVVERFAPERAGAQLEAVIDDARRAHVPGERV